MVKTVSAEDFANELVRMIKEYTEDVTQAIEKETESTANKVLQEAKNLAPKRTGEYARNFGKTKKKLSSGLECYVWNKKHYSRVHLLEFGHAKVGGGRVAARPHLRPAHDKYVDGYLNNIRQIIKKGGG